MNGKNGFEITRDNDQCRIRNIGSWAHYQKQRQQQQQQQRKIKPPPIKPINEHNAAGVSQYLDGLEFAEQYASFKDYIRSWHEPPDIVAGWWRQNDLGHVNKAKK